MPSINLDLNYFDHPKTKRLVGLLGRGADVLPVRLWCTCGKHYPDSGELTGLTAQEIESSVAWWGRTGEMVEAMVRVGFLERVGDSFRVHDWSDHASHIAMYREKSKKMVQAKKAKREKGADYDWPFATTSSTTSSTTSATTSQLVVQPMQCNAMQEEEIKTHAREPPPLSDPRDYNFTPQGLALNFRNAKPPGGINRLETVENVQEAMSGLLASGISANAILEEIKAKGRRRHEPIWEFEKRLRERHGNRSAGGGDVPASRLPIGQEVSSRSRKIVAPADAVPSASDGA